MHGVHWKPLNWWQPSIAVDVFVSFRSVEPLYSLPKARLRAVYLGDRQTPNLAQACARNFCNLIICISATQKQLYSVNLSKNVAWHIDSCGFDNNLFFNSSNKIEKRCIHTSIPYRGLENVLRIWPRIKSRFSYAELHVTGGYKLWGYNDSEAHRLALKDAPSLEKNLPGVVYHGSMRRDAYAALVRSAELFIYPTNYEEMCCIAALEASASGVVPVVSAVAALKERVRNNVDGSLIFYPAHSHESDDAFVHTITQYFLDKKRFASFSVEAALNAINFQGTKVVERLEHKFQEYLQ
jgi:glycosyltransferase involved in cell wall biosynthesis